MSKNMTIYSIYKSSHYRLNTIDSRVNMHNLFKVSKPLAQFVLVLLLTDYQLCFDSTQSLSPTETYQIKGLYLICNSA